MSGFEVAGIVLGAFPIALEGLKLYKELKDRWVNWQEIRREYEACLNDLEIQQTLFNFNLRYLLLPLVTEPQQIEALIAHPGGEEWSDPDLEQALRQRLHHSYDVYMKTIGSMRELIENAKNKYLRIESAELQARINATGGKNDIRIPMRESMKRSFRREIRYQQSRLRFTMGRATRKEFFVKLQTCNKALKELLDSSIRIQFPKQNILLSRYTGSMLHTGICEFWQHAQEVYNAFSEAWTCTCQYQHQTQLMLQHRKDNDRDLSLILRETRPNHSGVPSGHAVTIRESTDSEDVGQNQLSQSPERSQMRAPSSRFSRMKQGTTRTSASPVIKLQETRKGKGVDNAIVYRTRVTNLCSKIMEGFDSDPYSEYLQSGDRKYFIFSRTGTAGPLELQQLSLEDILCGPGAKIHRRQRYTISFNLVSSFIQLRKTSWVTSSWDKSYILFPEHKGYLNTSDLNEPFLTHRLQAATTVDLDPDLPTQDFSNLAVTLLELCFGKVIENHPKRPKLPPGVEDASMKAAFDAHAATFWLEDVTDEVGPDYKNAIAWCLSKHTTLSGPHWRQEMFQQVLHPLCEIIRPWASHSS